jgi:hypothetical protein
VLKRVKELARIAKEAGASVELLDYGFGCSCGFGDKWLVISRVFRPERDGYSGQQLIEEDLLREWLNENAPAVVAGS